MQKLLLATMFMLVLAPSLVFAQNVLPVHELSIQIVPTYPGPNENVSISIALYSGDLNTANIVWYKDGTKSLEGIGQTNFSFQTGPAGENTEIKIDVSLTNGHSFSKSFTLTPASVDLIWESDSYTPPFYKGKALHPRQGRLKIVAVPNFISGGERVPEASLVYEWSYDAGVYQNQSGYGKAVLVLDGSVLGRSERVYLSVTNPKNNAVAKNYLQITPADPEILFYENSPFYGPIFDRVIKNSFDLSGDEVQIISAPYYFSGNLTNLDFNWKVNRNSVDELSGSRTAIFRKPDEESGLSSISLSIKNLSKILQFADNSFNIVFEN